jgi:hypothetical protein
MVSTWQDAYTAERAAQADLVRCILGDPTWPCINQAWVTPTVADLARLIYDGRHFSGLPLLADVLVRAGCDDEQILGHLRGPGPHAMGCHVLDALTGRAGPVAGSEVGQSVAGRLNLLTRRVDDDLRAFAWIVSHRDQGTAAINGLRDVRNRIDEFVRRVEAQNGSPAGVMDGPPVRRIRRHSEHDAGGNVPPAGGDATPGGDDAVADHDAAVNHDPAGRN